MLAWEKQTFLTQVKNFPKIRFILYVKRNMTESERRRRRCLILDGWTFYSNDTPPAEYEAYRKNMETLQPGDKERLKNNDALLKLIAEKKVQNPNVGVEHHFKIYFDWAYAGANRMLLACDGERIDCQLELGMLMAEADYLIASEHLDSFERNKEDPLVLKFLTDKCLTCEENK